MQQLLFLSYTTDCVWFVLSLKLKNDLMLFVFQIRTKEYFSLVNHYNFFDKFQDMLKKTVKNLGFAFLLIRIKHRLNEILCTLCKFPIIAFRLYFLGTADDRWFKLDCFTTTDVSVIPFLIFFFLYPITC